MTDKLPPLSTQIANPSQILSAPTSAVHPSHGKDLPQKVESVEEEPYTIKCICNFPDDDGNTIFCETCETWQHIDCFYPDNREEALRENFAHSCHQCNPRPLDHKRAIERTKRLRNPEAEEETSDKKPKRPASKSHKKKQKPNDLQLNGAHSNEESSKHATPSDHHPPAKRPKTSHRSSHSINSQTAKKSPSVGNAKSQPNGHQRSPVATPPDLPLDFEIHNYSANFFSLHSEQDVQIVRNNSFVSLAVSNKMSSWIHDRESLKTDSGQEFKDVFQKLPSDIESRKRALCVEQKHYSPTPDKTLRLQYLSAPSAIEKDAPLIELNGQIGFQSDYCSKPDNLWTELTSPLPFVFFHPMLPLCIDTRKEGSEARYVRRSCKPNTVLDTYLSGGSEYHFWLVSDRHIAAKEQITLPWDFRFPNKEKARLLYLLGLGDDEMGGADQPEMGDTEYQHISAWLHRLLSEYGGCACDLGSNCAFARFHRHYLSRTQSRTNVPKKKRKAKTQNVSPTGTGHAANSRAASEGRLDDSTEADDRSMSSRSKPPSRDRTPVRHGSFDQLGILTEPTDRDKRKVAMAEDTFRRMEQQQLQQAPKKKKRVSDGSSSARAKSGRTASNNTTPNLANAVHYVDTGTLRSKSGSPAAAISPRAQFPPFRTSGQDVAQPPRQPSALPRSNYCDVSVQTDPVEGEWFSEPARSPRPRRRVISLSQRLLNNRRRQRIDEGDRGNSPALSAEPNAMDVDSPTTDRKSASSSPVLNKDTVSTTATSPPPGSGDVAMIDGTPTGTGPAPAVGVQGTAAASPERQKAPDLRVNMPPVPAFPNSATTTPLSATSSVTQSPFSANSLISPVNGIQPSPVKKKLSLSDYRRSRMDKAAAGKPPLSVKANLDEPKTSIDSIPEPQADEKPTPNGA